MLIYLKHSIANLNSKFQEFTHSIKKVLLPTNFKFLPHIPKSTGGGILDEIDAVSSKSTGNIPSQVSICMNTDDHGAETSPSDGNSEVFLFFSSLYSNLSSGGEFQDDLASVPISLNPKSADNPASQVTIYMNTDNHIADSSPADENSALVLDISNSISHSHKMVKYHLLLNEDTHFSAYLLDFLTAGKPTSHVPNYVITDEHNASIKHTSQAHSMAELYLVNILDKNKYINVFSITDKQEMCSRSGKNQQIMSFIQVYQQQIPVGNDCSLSLMTISYPLQLLDNITLLSIPFTYDTLPTNLLLSAKNTARGAFF